MYDNFTYDPYFMNYKQIQASLTVILDNMVNCASKIIGCEKKELLGEAILYENENKRLTNFKFGWAEEVHDYIINYQIEEFKNNEWVVTELRHIRNGLNFIHNLGEKASGWLKEYTQKNKL
jgi:hypothetical protein